VCYNLCQNHDPGGTRHSAIHGALGVAVPAARKEATRSRGQNATVIAAALGQVEQSPLCADCESCVKSIFAKGRQGVGQRAVILGFPVTCGGCGPTRIRKRACANWTTWGMRQEATAKNRRLARGLREAIRFCAMLRRHPERAQKRGNLFRVVGRCGLAGQEPCSKIHFRLDTLEWAG